MQCSDCRFMYINEGGMRCLMAEGFIMIEKIKNNLSYDDCSDFRPIDADKLGDLNVKGGE